MFSHCRRRGLHSEAGSKTWSHYGGIHFADRQSTQRHEHVRVWAEKSPLRWKPTQKLSPSRIRHTDNQDKRTREHDYGRYVTDRESEKQLWSIQSSRTTRFSQSLFHSLFVEHGMSDNLPEENASIPSNSLLPDILRSKFVPAYGCCT